MRTNIIVMTAVLLWAVPASVACHDSRAGYTSEEYTFERREDFRTAMSHQVDELESKLESLREKAARGGAELAQGTQEVVDDTRRGLSELRDDLAQVGSETKERWNDFQSAFSRKMGDVRRKLDDALD